MPSVAIGACVWDGFGKRCAAMGRLPNASSRSAGSSIKQTLRRVVQLMWAEPLLHFALLGSLLYGGYVVTRPESPLQITVPKELLAARRAELLRRDGRPPSESELLAAIADYIDGEVLFREAERRRLGEGDIIVRRRLIQKMEYVAEALLPREQPSDEILSAQLRRHPERYALPARTSVRQIFVSYERHPKDALSVAETLREQVRSGHDPASLGDPHPLGSVLPLHSSSELSQLFSPQLSAVVMQLPEKEWSAPIRSAHGFHLIQVLARQNGKLPSLEELRERLLLDYLEEQRPLRRRQAIDALRKNYQVTYGGGGGR